MTPLLAALCITGVLGVAGLPAIDRAVPDQQVNYLIIDVHTRQTLAERWPDADIPVPVGSLVKPFLALAYGRTFPELECDGKRMKFGEALAKSCNGYFLQ